MQVIWNILIPTLTGLGTGFGTWLFAREKNRRDLRAKDIENEKKSAEYYQMLVDDLTRRLEYTIEEFNKLEKKYKKLMETNEELIRELKKYKKQNDRDKR